MRMNKANQSLAVTRTLLVLLLKDVLESDTDDGRERYLEWTMPPFRA